ncbi:unnamed protein product, partial [Prorocentrum cordatum]
MAIDRRGSRLDWRRAAGTDERGERRLGKPRRGGHDAASPLARLANQYRVSYECARCDLVMLYAPNHGASGRHRQQGPLGSTVDKIKFEEITKQRPSRGSPRPTAEEASSGDSFEKGGAPDGEETPRAETKTSRVAEELDMTLDRAKRLADKQETEDLAARRGPGERPVDRPPVADDAGPDVATFGVDVECPKEDINTIYNTWVVDQAKDANAATDLYTKTLAESCTEEDSQLGQVAHERNDARDIRITGKGADLSKKSGLDYALKIADEDRGADLRGSLPCTAASALQNGYVGRTGTQQLAKLEAKRKDLRKMVDNFIVLGQRIRANGGDAHFERPGNCHGWELLPQLITLFFGEAEMEKANSDGRQAGVVSQKVSPIYKPWT